MNLLAFIAAMTGHLAWPVVVLAIVLLLRKPILKLIPTLQHMKLKDFEFDFSEKLEDAKQEVASLPPPPENEVPENARKRLTVDPNALPGFVVLQAWSVIEKSATELAMSAGVISAQGPFSGILRSLQSENVIDRQTYRAIEDLRRLRNVAAHSSATEISAEQAQEYLDTASDIVRHLDWIASRFKR